MKKVLAELHELISDFEDQGLTAEASSLQKVFIKVAQEADTEDDLANDVENILKSHSISEVLAEIAKRVETPKNTKTMSFAYGDEPAGYGFGNEPKDVIINEFVNQAKRKYMSIDDAYFMMNQRLQFNGHSTLGGKEFYDLVNSSDTNVSEFAFGDEPDSNANGTKMVPYPKQTPEHREQVLKDFREKMDEMNKYYDKNLPWTTAPMPYSSLSSENFYEKKR